MSDLDLSDVAYYQAFGYWKLACILQGVFARYVPAPRRATRAASRASRPRSGACSRWRRRRWSRSREPRQRRSDRDLRSPPEPVLHEPVLVVSLEGWVDAGLGATTAVAALLGQGPTEPLVTFNGEHFLDQRARRPVARIVNGVTTELTWPRCVVRQGTDESGRDMLFLVGPEPDFHWQAFTDAVVGLARSWRVRLVVGLGAFPAPAPHTRPVKLAATAPVGSSHLIEQVGVVQGELEVPAGVQAALEMAFGAQRHAHGQPVGPGAALRGGHAVPRGQRGVDRGPGRRGGAFVGLVRAAPRR